MQGFVYKSWYAAKNDINTPKYNLMHFQYICTKYKEAEYNPGCGFSLWGQFPFMKSACNIDDWRFACDTIKEVSKRRTIYRAVLSLDGETADAKGMNTREKWQEFTEKRIHTIAKEYDIKPENFCWAASFHFKEGHPHTHMMFWDNSDDIRQEYIPKKRFEVLSDKVREGFNKELFADELHEVYASQDNIKKDFKLDFKNALKALESEAQAGAFIQDELAQATGVMPCLGEADNTLSTELLNDDALRVLADKLYIVAQALPKTGSLDYKYLPKEVKSVLDNLTAEAIKTVPSFAAHHKALLKEINKTCQLYGNSEAGVKHNIQAAEKKLYTDLGNMCIKWLKQNAQQVDYVKETMALSNNEKMAREQIRAEFDAQIKKADSISYSDLTKGLQNNANEEPKDSFIVLGEDNTIADALPLTESTELPSVAKLLALFPQSYTRRSEYLKNTEIATALKAAVLDIMKCENVKSLLDERILLLHTDALHTAEVEYREAEPNVDYEKSIEAVKEAFNAETEEHFNEINKKRIEAGRKEINKNQYWREGAEVYSFVRNELLCECEKRNEWSEQWQRAGAEYAERERIWQENREHEMQVNLSVNLVINLSRLFKDTHWRNYKNSLNLSKDKSAGQRRDLHKTMLQRSSLHWNNEFER